MHIYNLYIKVECAVEIKKVMCKWSNVQSEKGNVCSVIMTSTISNYLLYRVMTDFLNPSVQQQIVCWRGRGRGRRRRDWSVMDNSSVSSPPPLLLHSLKGLQSETNHRAETY